MAGLTNVYAIFWEPTNNVSTNYNSLITRYCNDVGRSQLYQIANQYKQFNGGSASNVVLAGSWVDSRSYPETPLLDNDIQSEVTHMNAWKWKMSSVNLAGQ